MGQEREIFLRFENKSRYTVDFLTKKNNGQLTQYYITDNHPAIIPREDFLNAQLELTRRNSKKKVSQKKTKSVLGKYCNKYALSERLVCGECDSMYRRTTWSKKGKKKVVWRCISHLEFGTKYCQHSPTQSEVPFLPFGYVFRNRSLNSSREGGSWDRSPISGHPMAIIFWLRKSKSSVV